MACSGRHGIEHAVDVHRSECASAVTLCQSRIGAVIEFVGDCCYTDALAGIAEGFGTGDLQDVIVRVACDCCLIRRLKRFSEWLAEVHGEVGEVFDYNRVVFIRHLSDNLQFFFFQAEPGGIVGIGVDHGGYVSFGKILFQYFTQLFSAVFVNVERFIFITHHHDLLFLHRETRVDEQDRVFSRRALSADQE